MTYDLDQPNYSRIVTLQRNGQDVADDDRFTVAAGGFLAEGGDLYDSFPESEAILDAGKVSDVVIQHFRDHELVSVPERGRQWPVDKN
jgi:hypothetical protein